MTIYEWFAIGIGAMAWLYVWRRVCGEITYREIEGNSPRKEPDLVAGLVGGTLVSLFAPVWVPIAGICIGVSRVAKHIHFGPFFMNHVLIKPKEAVKELTEWEKMDLAEKKSNRHAGLTR